MKTFLSFINLLINLVFCLLFLSCHSKTNETEPHSDSSLIYKKNTTINSFNSDCITIHILVALCDNKYQGIVPVPPKIGNGQDPNHNLYWGAGYGVRTFFKKSKDWKFLKSIQIDSIKLERLIFQHTINKKYYLVADAYNGKNIKQCTEDFLYSCSGELKDTLIINKHSIGIYGNSNLLSYIGHDGLMDFQLSETFNNVDNQIRDCMIFACYSKKYFTPYIKNTKASPLLWTSHLMAPEAYTLHDALIGYVNNESNEQIRSRAVNAYSKYQKCSEKAARNLLVTGY